MEKRVSRTAMLLGAEAVEVLARSRVAVFGIGGVGGYAVEALVRSGVGALDIIDKDVVEESNLNRQIIATLDAIGRPKVDVMAERIASIDPGCRVAAHECFYLPDTASRFDFASYDYVVDALDTVTAKLQLITQAHEAGTPLVSCMGAANKLDPTAFEVSDIFDTQGCRLARIIRKECRKRGIAGFKVVYSREPSRRPFAELAGEETDRRSGVPGSLPFVPPIAGLLAAGVVVGDLVAAAGIEPAPLLTESR